MEPVFCILSLLYPILEVFFNLTGGVIHTPCGTIHLLLDNLPGQEIPEITYAAQWYLFLR
jgi:hypothetical protein